jgi:hypothetical protein
VHDDPEQLLVGPHGDLLTTCWVTRARSSRADRDPDLPRARVGIRRLGPLQDLRAPVRPELQRSHPPLLPHRRVSRASRVSSPASEPSAPRPTQAVRSPAMMPRSSWEDGVELPGRRRVRAALVVDAFSRFIVAGRPRGRRASAWPEGCLGRTTGFASRIQAARHCGRGRLARRLTDGW